MPACLPPFAGSVIESRPPRPRCDRDRPAVGVDAMRSADPSRPPARSHPRIHRAGLPAIRQAGCPRPSRQSRNPSITMTSFDAFGLAAPLGRALARLDIHVPTPIQAAAIPLLMSGSDLVATAPTGTGKTAAFMLPALHRIASGQGAPGRGPRVLVLAPTRELAQQVDRATQELGRLLPRFSSVCITGGASYQVQNRQLAAPHEVLVATPGRFIDQLRAGRIDLARVDTLVLDEADRMLDMGFADDVLQIAAAVPAGRQTVCFTATLSRGVRQLAAGLLRDPQWLSIERAHAERTAIDDHVIYVDDAAHRDRLLQACLRDAGLGQAIVFTATRRHAEELARFLHREGFAAEALHG